MDPFTALADPVRRDLVVRLSRGPARVVDLTAAHDISRPAISRHLRVLAEAGLVVAEDRGRERHYRLRVDGLAPVTDLLGLLLSQAAEPPVAERLFDGLEIEVLRAGRDRRRTRNDSHSQEDTA